MMNRKTPRISPGQPPCHRHPEQQSRDDEDQSGLDHADDHERGELADHHFERLHRRREQALHRPALLLAGHADRGHHDEGQGQDDAEQTGDDIVSGDVLRIVAAVDDHFERGRGVGRLLGRGACEVVAQRFPRQRGERGERASGRGRIGGVGLDQDLRLVAAHHAPGEIAGNGDRELDLAGRDQLVELGRAARLARDRRNKTDWRCPETTERAKTLFSCTRTAVGRCRGSVLIA